MVCGGCAGVCQGLIGVNVISASGTRVGDGGSDASGNLHLSPTAEVMLWHRVHGSYTTLLCRFDFHPLMW